MMEEETLKKQMTVAWLIWGSMLLSLGVYVVVAHVLADSMAGRTAEASGQSTADLLRYPLIGAAVVIFIVTHYVRKLMLKKAAEKKTRPLDAEASSQMDPIMARYLPVVVVSGALSEAVGIFGLVLFLVGADFNTLYVFIAASAAALYTNRPRLEEVKDLVEADRIGGLS